MSIGSSCSTLLTLEESSVSENSEAEGPVQAFNLESSPPVSKMLFWEYRRQPPPALSSLYRITSSSHSTDLTTPMCPCCHVCESNQGALGFLKVERVNKAISPL